MAPITYRGRVLPQMLTRGPLSSCDPRPLTPASRSSYDCCDMGVWDGYLSGELVIARASLAERVWVHTPPGGINTGYPDTSILRRRRSAAGCLSLALASLQTGPHSTDFIYRDSTFPGGWALQRKPALLLCGYEWLIDNNGPYLASAGG